jgi:hypothetical protein
MAQELPRSQLLDCLIAAYEAGRLLHMTRSTLVGLLGSVTLRCIDDQVDGDAQPAPPAAGLWPRIVNAAAYDDFGNLMLSGADDNDHPWHETVAGRSQEAWLLKQLYIERKFGRRNQKYNLNKPHRKLARKR